MPGNAIPEMIYTVSDGTLNPTHSLTHLRPEVKTRFVYITVKTKMRKALG